MRDDARRRLRSVDPGDVPPRVRITAALDRIRSSLNKQAVLLQELEQRLGAATPPRPKPRHLRLAAEPDGLEGGR